MRSMLSNDSAIKVEFANGNTKGEQMSPYRDSMEEVLLDLKQIMDSVNNK